MHRPIVAFMVAAAFMAAGCVGEAPAAEPAPTPEPVLPLVCGHATYPAKVVRTVMETSKGAIAMELDGVNAPVTVCNFLRYVGEDFYDDTIFHRICRGFVIQAGGWESTDAASQRETHDPIRNEAPESALMNLPRTVGMARELDEPDSATSHFYISLRDNRHLDPGGYDKWGFAVFGRVVDGWPTVVEIEETPTIPTIDASCPEGNPLPTMETTIEDVRVV